MIGDGDNDAHRLDDSAGREVGQGLLDSGNQLLVVQQPLDGALIENDDTGYPAA